MQSMNVENYCRIWRKKGLVVSKLQNNIKNIYEMKKNQFNDSYDTKIYMHVGATMQIQQTQKHWTFILVKIEIKTRYKLNAWIEML